MACSHRRHMYYSGARPGLLTSRFCQACDSALIVGHDGLLSFCYEVCDRRHELAGDFLFGRLGSDGGVQVDFGRRLSFRNKIERRRQGCRSCFCFRHCAGDCPAKTFSPDSGELSLTDRCWLNREITKNILIRYIERGGGVWRGEGAREAEGL